MSMKISNDTIKNRTRNLTTCSAVPKPTAPPLIVVGYRCEKYDKLTDELFGVYMRRGNIWGNYLADIIKIVLRIK